MPAKGIKYAIEWIALNDAAGDNQSAEDMVGYVSVALVADLFDKSPEEIAQRVFEKRNGKTTTIHEVWWREAEHDQVHTFRPSLKCPLEQLIGAKAFFKSVVGNDVYQAILWKFVIPGNQTGTELAVYHRGRGVQWM